MRVASWQSIIISWANALKLLEEPINDIIDLVKGSFFIKLLNKIKNENTDENLSEYDVYTVIENFLKEQYGGFRLLGYWDSDEVTLVSSVLLLWASLQSQDFRTPLYDLNNIVQLKIHAFLEHFIETPQHHINRQIVMEAVLDIPSDDESDDDSSSYISSPRTYSTPKRNSQYSPGFLALSEVRTLRGKVELLSCEKQHLQDELDSVKSQLKETINKLDYQKRECNRLNYLVTRRDEDIDLCQEKSCNDQLGKIHDESVSLRLELNDLKEVHDKLLLQMESAMEDNNNLSRKLRNEELRRVNAENRIIGLESKLVSSNEKILELEEIILSLKKTCEEQRNILLEKRNISLEESFQYSEGETLNSIIDIKCSELQEELKLQGEILEAKSNEIEKLLTEKTNNESLIQKLTDEVKILKLSASQEKITNCNECQNMRDELATLKKDFSGKCLELIKLQEDFDKQTLQLKIINNNKAADEVRITELNANTNRLITEHKMKCNELREEILALKCEVCEKNTTIEYYKEEVGFLNSCIKDRGAEMKTLEDDYDVINSSKDKEISQLSLTIEHLNREVRRLEDQLQGQYVKNEKLVLSAFQWREKMTQGNTANEELARELISLHETLEWKNFKMKEYSMQIEQFQRELKDKSLLIKELHDRLSFFSDRNKEYQKELQMSKNTITQLQSRIVELEFSEKKLLLETCKNSRKIGLLGSELEELQKVFQEKFAQIESELESNLLRENSGVKGLLDFVDFLKDTLRKNKKMIKVLSQTVSKFENVNAEKTFDVDSGIESSGISKKVNEVLENKILELESEIENNKCKLQIYSKKLEQVKEETNVKDTIISELKTEIEKLTKERSEKLDLIDRLKQNVNLYEHEKNILEKKLKSFSLQTGETASVKAENKVLKNDVIVLEKQLEEERENLLTVEKQMNLEEKLDSAFEEKLVVLQAKLTQQFDDEMKNVMEEYSRKIEQLKLKIKKDCVHIEQLSSDLWETSDRLVLAQQESEALRSQLRITRQMLSDHQTQKRGVEDSHSFMWLGGLDGAGFIDEMVTTVTTKRTVQAQAARVDEDDDNEDFNPQYLEDLKAGICRIPAERLSCPTAGSSLTGVPEDTFQPPAEKPRKLKGTITYRKPGPPTPSINAARHSLPGNEKLEFKKGLREHNSNTGQVRNRLSQLFGSMSISKTKSVQESPKVKRRSFFQRTFGNRENIPPK
ncbi:putative leucine-rich repeat-containing protein DDB_G0290503 isoform X2 [Halyomorpha halys]|uniref:putative leucine-rich repeat-containing protein DDB_G0290503 isoform X2 n=1 Tax=Halyomorpha halys TaxID=286706 RepID=UPI0006D52504|nr:synaptonemal complex protein 1 isoform X2 [Halyomorpha halys]